MYRYVLPGKTTESWDASCGYLPGYSSQVPAIQATLNVLAGVHRCKTVYLSLCTSNDHLLARFLYVSCSNPMLGLFYQFRVVDDSWGTVAHYLKTVSIESVHSVELKLAVL